MFKPILIILAIISFISCKDRPKLLAAKMKIDTSLVMIDQQILQPVDVANKIRATDYTFFSDSIFHGYKNILKYYFQKYCPDSCKSLSYDRKELKEYNDGVAYLGYINTGRKSSVFILQPFNYDRFENEEGCDGEAYYFTDTTLPRLQTNSYCCRPSYIFLVGDIDEDGVSEIGQYYSSCSSHYKSLWVWTLKNGQWKSIGRSVFDQRYMAYDKPFASYIKKVSKDKFKMLEITDLTHDKTKMGKPNWKEFSM